MFSTPHHWCLPFAQYVRSLSTICAKHQHVS